MNQDESGQQKHLVQSPTTPHLLHRISDTPGTSSTTFYTVRNVVRIALSSRPQIPVGTNHNHRRVYHLTLILAFLPLYGLALRFLSPAAPREGFPAFLLIAAFAFATFKALAGSRIFWLSAMGG